MTPRLLGSAASRWLARYYLGPDHPGKLRLLNAFFRISGARLKVPYAQRGWISLNPLDGQEDTILRYGVYEPEVWDSLAAHARPGDVFWDVGSNIGGIGIRAGLDDRIREVHCFEPHPGIYQVLSANLACNPGRPLKAHPVALSDKEERRTIHSGASENSGAASLTERAGGRSFEVTCTTADRFLAEKKAPPPNLMKIDVEGWEMNVLLGAKELFSKTPPRAVVAEAASDPKGGLADAAMAAFFREHGYRAQHLKRNYDKIEAVENYLFLHE